MMLLHRHCEERSDEAISGHCIIPSIIRLLRFARKDRCEAHAKTRVIREGGLAAALLYYSLVT